MGGTDKEVVTFSVMSFFFSVTLLETEKSNGTPEMIPLFRHLVLHSW